jgi:RNA polymerase sigma-B factor
VLANAEVPASNARRYRNSDEPMEELVQTAYLGLVKAANGYLPDRGHDFWQGGGASVASRRAHAIHVVT